MGDKPCISGLRVTVGAIVTYWVSKIVLLACIALCFGFPILRCDAADSENPMPLAEVHTWGDLLARKPVVTDQVKTYGYNSPPNVRPSFKIGIDRTNSKRYDCAILYCLVQGDTNQHGDGNEKMPDSGFGPLGPFLINIQRLDHVAAASPRISVCSESVSQSGGAVLYMHTIPLDLAGEYSILVQGVASDPDPKDATLRTIAAATVTVSGEATAVWIPWVMPPNPSEPWREARKSTIEVAIPPCGPALPQWQGWAPITIPKLPDANRPLPELISATPDPGIQLALKGNELIVKLDQEIALTFEDDCFLTRWWVNGKPFIPKLEPTRFHGGMHDGLDSRYKELHYKMEFDPAVLGLKKSDIVGVQLLECPNGWRYIGPADGMPQGEWFRKEYPVAISRLSNRIDFVYSGDPKSIVRNQATD